MHGTVLRLDVCVLSHGLACRIMLLSTTLYADRVMTVQLSHTALCSCRTCHVRSTTAGASPDDPPCTLEYPLRDCIDTAYILKRACRVVDASVAFARTRASDARSKPRPLGA